MSAPVPPSLDHRISSMHNTNIQTNEDTEPFTKSSQPDHPLPLTWQSEGKVHANFSHSPHIPFKNDTNCLIEDSGDVVQSANNAAPSRVLDNFDNESLSTSIPFIDPSSRSSDDIGEVVSAGRQSISLESELRSSKTKSIGEDEPYFIPISDLDRILSQENILRELNRLNIGPVDGRASAVNDICMVRAGGEPTTRRKLLAILCLMDKVEPITDLIHDKVYDEDLPFTFSEDRSIVRSKRTGEVIQAFQKPKEWRNVDKDVFNDYQWWMLSPYFEFSCKVGENLSKVKRYPVYDRAVLPFISETLDTKQPPWNEGGFSIVRKVKFHPAHYNSQHFIETDGTNPFFAVKTLKIPANEEDLHNREVESLIRLNDEEHNHLIRLLVTFQYRNQLHLVFPWADGNLQDFWKNEYPDPHTPPRDFPLARWMASQCLGLGLGLKKIHLNPINKARAQARDLQPDTPQKKNGRHGDMKPENILWFKNSDNLGVLKISDFGFVEFHATRSKDDVPLDNLGCSATYRAPEWDVKKKLASSYDIWCIGCVFLEFVEWYLEGAKGVETFIQKRLANSINDLPNFEEDNFFNLTKMEYNQRKAQAKLSVHEEIHRLRKHDRCSDFILDLLDYIEDYLLRMAPKKRASCDELVYKLQAIHNKCFQGMEYCTERKQQIPEHRDTKLSELAHFLSPKLDKGSFNTAETSRSVASPELASTICVDENTFSESLPSGTNEQGSASTLLPLPTAAPATAAIGPQFDSVTRSSHESYEESNALLISGLPDSPDYGTTNPCAGPALEIADERVPRSERSEFDTLVNSNANKNRGDSRHENVSNSSMIKNFRSCMGWFSALIVSCFPTNRRSQETLQT